MKTSDTKSNYFAAVDMGSNSFRLLIARSSAKGLAVVQKELVTVRLSENMRKNNVLSSEAQQRAIQALHFFKSCLEPFNIEQLRACGTEALRKANRKNIFLQKASSILGAPVEILTGEEEAALSFAGVSGFLPVVKKNTLVFDVGGSSTETICKGKGPAFVKSFPLGAVGLTEAFYLDQIPSNDNLAAARQHIYSHITQILAPQPDSYLIGTGGTITALAALDLNLAHYDEKKVHGHVLRASSLNKLIANFSSLTGEERNKLAGLDHGRGEIILGGALIFQIILDHFSQEKILVSDTGLLEGILLSCYSPVTPKFP